MIGSCGLTFVGAQAGGKKKYVCSCGHEVVVGRDDDAPVCARDLANEVASIGSSPPAGAGQAALDAALEAVSEATPTVREAGERLMGFADPTVVPISVQPLANVRLMKREGGTDPNEVLIAALADSPNFDRVAVVAFDKEAGYVSCWSDMGPEQLVTLARVLTYETDAVLVGDDEGDDDGS